MKRFLAGLVVVSALTGGVSVTDSAADEAMRLAPGSVILRDAVRVAPTEPARLELLRTRTLSAGTTAGTRSSLFGGPTLELGGFLEYDSEYHFDAGLRRGPGATTTGIGMGYGSTVNGTDTSYLVRLGAGVTEASRGPSYFSLNPTTTAGDFESESQGRDVNLSLTLSHSFTPNLFLNGTAAARRSVGAGSDSTGVQGDNQFQFGAGLGYRF